MPLIVRSENIVRIVRILGHSLFFVGGGGGGGEVIDKPYRLHLKVA